MRVKTTAIRSIGSLFVGETKSYNVERIEDNGTYWSLVINSNSKVIVSKENWNMEIFTTDKEYKKMLIEEVLKRLKNNPLVKEDFEKIRKDLKKEPITPLEKMCNISSQY